MTSADDKAPVRDAIDFTDAEWKRTPESPIEWASVEHGGHTYYGVRGPDENGHTVTLTFTESEWAAFKGGAQDGEFD